MSLRLVEATVPSDRLDELLDELGSLDTMDVWSTDDDGERAHARVLVADTRTEEVTDHLTDQFEDVEGFRVTVLAVEATFPPEPDHEDAAVREAPERVSREELYEDLSSGSRVTLVYLVTVVLSTIVAGVGLMRDDVAAIIGAMVIAPLLAPNVALSLAATLGDLDLARRAAGAAVSGIAVALAVSAAMGALVTFDPTTTQIAGRSHVGLGDAVLALAAGSAGALAYTTGLSTVVVGVMVAVALVPPLVAAGLFLGAGLWSQAAGAGILTFTNLTAINLAGVVTFLAQKVAPRTWYEEKRARKARWFALASWVVIFGILVALIFWVADDPMSLGGANP